MLVRDAVERALAFTLEVSLGLQLTDDVVPHLLEGGDRGAAELVALVELGEVGRGDGLELLTRHLAVEIEIAVGEPLVLVGIGSLDRASRFARAKNLPRDGVSIYADPTRASFEAASLVRGTRHVFNTASVRAYLRAKGEGFRITGVSGDVSQLGGLLVVEPPARLRYLHRSAFTGDHPSTEQILGALK